MGPHLGHLLAEVNRSCHLAAGACDQCGAIPTGGAMTSLAAAIACDSRGPSALYLITDSRITWVQPTERWDVGRKTFASLVSADVFGYCGDAYFMPIALGQVLSLVASGVVDTTTASAEERHTAVLDLLKNSLGKSLQSTRPQLRCFTVHVKANSCLLNSGFGAPNSARRRILGQIVNCRSIIALTWQASMVQAQRK
jgi:hypothetical protein